MKYQHVYMTTQTLYKRANRVLKVGAALAALGADVYGKTNAVGTVSQSGGVPTGALAEYGSNANGEYWKYVGGMMVCVSKVQLTTNTLSTNMFGSASGNSYIASGAFNFPASFISSPSLSVQSTSGLGRRCAKPAERMTD